MAAWTSRFYYSVEYSADGKASPPQLEAAQSITLEQLNWRGEPDNFVLQEVAEMRSRIAAAKAPEGPLDAKIGAGRLQDIELFAETGALMAGSAERRIDEQLEAAVRAFGLDDSEEALLSEALDLFWRVQASARLVAGEGSVKSETTGAGAGAFLLRETGATSVGELEGRLTDLSARVAKLISKHIGSSAGSP